MTASTAADKKPLWLEIEESILKLDPKALGGGGMEPAVRDIAEALGISDVGGSMLELRWALEAAGKAGRPLLKDLNDGIAALTLDDVANTRAAASKLIGEIGKSFPELVRSERKEDVIGMIEAAKLKLLTAKAKTLADDMGIRLLIEEGIGRADIMSGLGITDDKLKEVEAKIEAERAERARAEGLLKELGDKPAEEKVKHLITNDVALPVITEVAGVDQAVIDKVKQAMEKELEEKRRLAEEEAARKKKEAEGPGLDDIPNDQMLEYIESIREILEFSTEEKEIRVMCGQSSIPKALVDITVSSPEKLDELEKKAGG